jgi:hypothetical protein
MLHIENIGCDRCTLVWNRTVLRSRHGVWIPVPAGSGDLSEMLPDPGAFIRTNLRFQLTLMLVRVLARTQSDSLKLPNTGLYAKPADREFQIFAASR